jgi:hypothetical protein
LAAVIEHHKLSGINSGLCSRSASYRFSSQTLLERKMSKKRLKNHQLNV